MCTDGCFPLPLWKVSAFQLFTVLSYTNSAINPVLYAFASGQFRRNFLGAFLCFRSFAHAQSIDESRCRKVVSRDQRENQKPEKEIIRNGGVGGGNNQRHSAARGCSDAADGVAKPEFGPKTSRHNAGVSVIVELHAKTSDSNAANQ